MKIRLFVCTAFALIVAALTTARAADAVAPPTITTTGNVELRVPADLADLQFAVKIRSSELTVARNDEAERAVRIIKAMRDAGIEEKDLQTSQAGISTSYEENQRQETAKVNYYEVEQHFLCTLRDVKKVPDLTSAVLTAGATEIGRIELRTSALRQHLDEARAQAIRAAREKAVAIAKELNVKVGKPFRIAENMNGEAIDGSIYTRIGDAPVAGVSPSQGVFAAGLIAVSARVDVTFFLE